MTIIFEMGNRFWIEELNAVVPLVDAAGRVSSPVGNLTRAGVYLGGAVYVRFGPDNDNVQAVGTIEILDQASGTLDSGDNITGIIVRANKELGTAGATNLSCNVLMFMRGSGS